jgi:hypothetical protein
MENQAFAPFIAETEIALFGNEVLEFVDFQGRKTVFTPDDTKGFFQFALAHAFPAGRTAFKTALHPAVTGNSWSSILYQNVNYEHQIKSYHKEPGKDTNVEDRILGSVVAASYPNTPTNGWKLTPGSSSAPVGAISGVASFAKLATAMNKVVGEHQTGRHRYTVSMEVRYDYTKAGFLVAANGKVNSGTPDDIAQAGYEWFAWSSASEELQATFSPKKNRVIKDYRGRDTTLMMGGIDGTVHFAGVGLVKYGAERTAKILQMAASGTPGLLEPIAQIPELLRQAFGLSDSDKE